MGKIYFKKIDRILFMCEKYGFVLAVNYIYISLLLIESKENWEINV